MNATATATQPETREQVMGQIAELKFKLKLLEQRLSKMLGKFYRVAVHNPRQVFVIYAADAAQAQERLEARLLRDFGDKDGGKATAGVTKVFTDPRACMLSLDGSLCRAIGRPHAKELAEAYLELISMQPKKSLLQNTGYGDRVESDCKNYLIGLKADALRK